MKYIQTNQQNEFVRHLSNATQYWDENNFCTPEALIKDGKAEQFGVVPLIEVSPPQFDAMTQEVIEAPPAQAGVQSLEAAGLLAPGRALQILDAPLQADERPLP